MGYKSKNMIRIRLTISLRMIGSQWRPCLNKELVMTYRREKYTVKVNIKNT